MVMPTVRRHWAADGDTDVSWLASPRDDLILETAAGDGAYIQAEGPLAAYRRTLTRNPDGSIDEVTRYRVGLPWFGWVFAPFVRHTLRHRPSSSQSPGRQPWWAPPDRLTPDQILVIGLLAAASMCAAFTNTLFTQTVGFAAKTFHVSNSAQGDAGTVVRLAIVLGLPFALLADRIGRRRMIQFLAFVAPAICSLGALAPNFAALTATQAVGRSLGLVLDLLIAVMAAEIMPRNSRAYAVSVLAMAAGLGAGVCVMSLRLADIAPEAWRWVYVLALIWMIVAVDLARRLPETRRFLEHSSRHTPRHAGDIADKPTPMPRRRLGIQAAALFFANLFVAPASLFQNRYLDEVRGYSGGGIALFTLVTQTPAGLGILLGGRIADRRGRRVLGAVSVVCGTGLVLWSFATGGWPMWVSALFGGVVGGAAGPALGVYRAEMFHTGQRSSAGYLVTAAALCSGAIGLQITGYFLDRGNSHARVLGALALGQLAVAFIVLRWFPETAHRELEELNPEDAGAPASVRSPRAIRRP